MRVVKTPEGLVQDPRGPHGGGEGLVEYPEGPHEGGEDPR